MALERVLLVWSSPPTKNAAATVHEDGVSSDDGNYDPTSKKSEPKVILDQISYVSFATEH